jgi:cell division protein FtsB
MAFHLPKEPIRTKREFLLYLLATAAGVLLALSLERAGEWWHARSLVAEARKNLVQEINSNRRRIASWRGKVEQMKKNLNEVSEFADESLRTGKSGKHSLSVSFEGLQLLSSAWNAAQTTGALGHMEYREAKEYAELYNLQSELQRMQSITLDNLSEVMGFFRPGADPTRNQRPPELDRLGERARSLNMRLTLMDGLAKGADQAGAAIQQRSEGK